MGSLDQNLPIAKRWGGGPPAKPVVEGPHGAIAGPSVSRLATATSPSLRDGEELG